MFELLLDTPIGKFGEQEVMTSPDVGQNSVRIGAGYTLGYQADRLWILSGRRTYAGATNKVMCRWTPSTNAWLIMKAIPAGFTANEGWGIVGLDDKFIWATCASASLLYQIGTDTWVTKATITDPAMQTAGVQVCNYMGYAFRVGRTQSGNTCRVLRYRPIDDTHQIMLDIGKDFGLYTCTKLVGHRIYIFPNNSTAGAVTEWGYYDILTNKYVACGNWTSGTNWVRGVVQGTYIYLFGCDADRKGVYEVDLRDNMMRKRVSLIRPTSNALPIVVNGKLMLWGGTSDDTDTSTAYANWLTYNLDPYMGYINQTTPQ